jgi:hypothetical protein
MLSRLENCFLCYTFFMKSDLTQTRSLDLVPATEKPVKGGSSGTSEALNWRPLWQKWAQSLRHLGLGDLAASLLEASGSLNVLNAQLIYVSQPVLGLILPEDDLITLARTLEEPERVRDFVSLIREEGTL